MGYLGNPSPPEQARERRVTQLRKGILELAVMGVLNHQSHYGYSLVRALTDGGLTSLKEGTIYPILARLDRDGLVRSEWVESEQGPPRKYYALTPSGRSLFDDLSQELALLVSMVKPSNSHAPESTYLGRKLAIRKA